jgi:uroporphyrinogen III methyltransferase/synthase
MPDVPPIGRVFLVGAGPGDPGLLTLRAVECLQLADFVLYDYLTSPRTLDFARPEAERLRVTELPGPHPERWRHITARIIDEARRGKTVVHLKGGDPFVFGRGAEEAEALRAAGVPYEIVPGVTAALAAAACAEVPLTHRAYASAVALVTGHEDSDKPGSRLDWEALARFPGTLAVYMGVSQLGHILSELVVGGLESDTPAALVYRASTGEQRTVVGTVASLDDQVRRAGVTSPALTLIGPAVALKPAVSWFEARPLFGMRVVVTRPRAQALPFVRELELLGAIPYQLPVMTIAPPADWGPADSAIREMRDGAYDWVAFTSANGVVAFLDRLRTLGLDGRAIGRTKLAAIGPATAAALSEGRLNADLVSAKEMRSEELAELLIDRCRDGRVLLVQAAEARQRLMEELSSVAQVNAVAIYRQVPGIDPESEVWDRLRRGEVHAVTLTSPNIASAFLAACDERIRERLADGTTRLVANSERLAEFLRQQGLPSIVAPAPTTAGLIAALQSISRPGRR